jgi:hypothetical protein
MPSRDIPAEVTRCFWRPSLEERTVRPGIWSGLEDAITCVMAWAGDLRGNSVLQRLQQPCKPRTQRLQARASAG